MKNFIVDLLIWLFAILFGVFMFLLVIYGRADEKLVYLIYDAFGTILVIAGMIIGVGFGILIFDWQPESEEGDLNETVRN